MKNKPNKKPKITDLKKVKTETYLIPNIWIVILMNNPIIETKEKVISIKFIILSWF